MKVPEQQSRPSGSTGSTAAAVADSAPRCELLFCIFSFNRGQFLENCVQSIEQCSPSSKIVIYDDDSTDPQTLLVLDRLAKAHSVVSSGETEAGKHGGLQHNMQLALNLMPDDQLFCFVQDDMQLIRPVQSSDIAAMQEYLSAPEGLARASGDDSRGFGQPGFLHPVMLKGVQRVKDQKRTSVDRQRQVYTRSDTGRATGVYFADVLISNSSLLRDTEWSFMPRESENEQQAKARFCRMGFMLNPIMMWLPSVPAWRGKKRTLSLRVAEKKQYCGLHPFKIMDASSNREFCARDPSLLPIAEDFLEIDSDKVIADSGFRKLAKPWKYGPFQGAQLLKAFNRFELALRRR